MSQVGLDKGPGNKAVSDYPGSVAKGMFQLKLPNSLFAPDLSLTWHGVCTKGKTCMEDPRRRKQVWNSSSVVFFFFIQALVLEIFEIGSLLKEIFSIKIVKYPWAAFTIVLSYLPKEKLDKKSPVLSPCFISRRSIPCGRRAGNLKNILL